MSFLARLSLKNRSLIALATIAILLFGAFVIPTLKQELFPSLDFPAVSVVTVDAGASPSIVEHDITNPLEQSIQGIAGIQQVTSYSNQGFPLLSSNTTLAPTSTRQVRRWHSISTRRRLPG